MRVKLISIVAILWVAAVGVTTLWFHNHRAQNYIIVKGRYFRWEDWWVWMGGLTAAALAAIAIIVILTRRSD